MKNSKKRLIKFLNLIDSTQEQNKLSQVFSKVLSKGIFILGEEVKNFEENFAEYLKVKYCVGVASGQEALKIALTSLGIGQNDEVITTPISAAATTLAILSVGAKPIFVDTTENGLINPDLIPPAITEKTKAILPVHLYGNPARIDKIKNICQSNNLFLIEDAAQAHGSTFKSKKLGTFGDIGCFSFYPTKNLGALGDGGAIVTNNSNLAKICYELRDYGQESKYLHTRLGFNSRLDEIQAAFLNIRLKSLDINNYKRRRVALRYIKKLSKLSDIQLILPDNTEDANFHLFVIKTKRRNNLMKYLKDQGIETFIHFPTIIPDQPILKKDYGSALLPIARSFVKICLSLPCHPQMSLDEAEYISEKINAA